MTDFGTPPIGSRRWADEFFAAKARVSSIP